MHDAFGHDPEVFNVLFFHFRFVFSKLSNTWPYSTKIVSLLLIFLPISIHPNVQSRPNRIFNFSTNYVNQISDQVEASTFSKIPFPADMEYEIHNLIYQKWVVFKCIFQDNDKAKTSAIISSLTLGGYTRCSSEVENEKWSIVHVSNVYYFLQRRNWHEHKSFEFLNLFWGESNFALWGIKSLNPLSQCCTVREKNEG